MRPSGTLGRLAIAIAVVACRDPRARGRTDVDAAPSAVSTSASTSASASASATLAADVISSASPTWTAREAGPPPTTTDGVDGAALRARTRDRLAMDASPVTVLQGEGPFELGRRICEAKVPRVAAATPVLIKPNLGGFEWFKDPKANGGDDGLRGRITQPEFVRGIIRCLKARGHAAITVAEGWGATHADFVRLARASGYDAMTHEEGVRLVAMDDDGVFDVEGDRPGKPLVVRGMEATHVPTLLLPKILAEHLDHGLFISAPKLKAHRFGVVSIAIKGMQGTVMLSDARPYFHQKWRTHRELGPALEKGKAGEPDARRAYVASLEVFAERMTDVLEIAAPHVVLAEGAPAMGGDGFGAQWPMTERVAVGGTNPVLVDRVGAELLGLWDSAALERELPGHRTSPLVEVAARRLGVAIARPSVDGAGAALLSERRPANLVGMAGFEIHAEGAGGYRTARAAALGDRAVEVDGKPDDPAWASAPRVAWDTDFAGRPTGTETAARFLWSKDALYILWELSGAGLDNSERTRSTTEDRDALHEEDCVEMFLAPDPRARDRYFEVEVGPFGHFLDLAVSARKGDAGWSSKPTIATTRDAGGHRAVLEVALRAPDVMKALVPGARLPLGLFRMEGRAARRYLAWSPARTKTPDFHVPAAFGTLLIER